ncbi:MAG: hypothetical protein QW791_00170 [Candidatus Bathyarchaeia archaeon]
MNVEPSPSNIYANLSAFVTVLIPGVILCLAPMMVCLALSFSNILYALIVFLAIATLELATVVAIINLLVKN